MEEDLELAFPVGRQAPCARVFAHLELTVPVETDRNVVQPHSLSIYQVDGFRSTPVYRDMLERQPGGGKMRRVILQYSIVVPVGYVEIASCVERNAGRMAFRSATRPAPAKVACV